MLKIAMIAMGGAVGSVLRYAGTGLAQKISSGGFPIGTLTVNVAGCLVIGWVFAMLSGPLLVREEIRVGVMVGLLGGFTTFSTYALETFSLANDGQRTAAIANILLSNGLGLAAVWIAFRLGQRYYGA
jgi:fluoride exporter